MKNQRAVPSYGGLRTRDYSKCTEDVNKPLISIITVVFNGAEHIEKTIFSIIEQNYDNFEYIIIDGGSTDGTVDIIRRHESNIDYWVSELDSGIYDAMNKAQRLASGNFLWFINAGDEIADKYILKDLSSIMTTDCDYVFSGTHIINIDGSPKKTVIPPIPLTFDLMTKGMHVSHQSFIPRREIAPIYDLQYKLIADQKWILDCMKYGQTHGSYFDRPLSRYMAGGISDLRSLDCVVEKIHMIKKHFSSYYPKNLPQFIFEVGKAIFKKFVRKVRSSGY